MNSNSVEDLFLVTFIQNLIGNRVRGWWGGRGGVVFWMEKDAYGNE